MDTRYAVFGQTTLLGVLVLVSFAVPSAGQEDSRLDPVAGETTRYAQRQRDTRTLKESSEVLSVRPATVSPGETVTISGIDFGPAAGGRRLALREDRKSARMPLVPLEIVRWSPKAVVARIPRHASVTATSGQVILLDEKGRLLARGETVKLVVDADELPDSSRTTNRLRGRYPDDRASREGEDRASERAANPERHRRRNDELDARVRRPPDQESFKRSRPSEDAGSKRESRQPDPADSYRDSRDLAQKDPNVWQRRSEKFREQLPERREREQTRDPRKIPSPERSYPETDDPGSQLDTRREGAGRPGADSERLDRDRPAGGGDDPVLRAAIGARRRRGVHLATETRAKGQDKEISGAAARSHAALSPGLLWCWQEGAPSALSR